MAVIGPARPGITVVALSPMPAKRRKTKRAARKQRRPSGRPAEVPNPLDEIRAQLATKLPQVLVDRLLEAYQELRERFLTRHWEPAELNGGKFVEAVIRILQSETAGSYTKLGKSIPNVVDTLRKFEQIPENDALESYRIHIPRTLLAIYNVRNKRGVGHLGGDVNPNYADATLIVSIAGWVLAELLRVHFQWSLEQAQKVVDGLVARPVPLVHEVRGVRRVLLTSLSQREQVLLLLASVANGELTVEQLIESSEPSNPADFRSRILGRLHSDRLVEYRNDEGVCVLLPSGRKHVEDSYEEWESKLQRGP